MKILFIHEVSYLDKVIFEMHEFPEYLASFGHDVAFIDFPESERLLPYRWRPRRQTIPGRVVKNSRIFLISLPRRLPRPFDRLLCAATFLGSANALIREVSPDVIVLYAVPTNGWQVIRIARRHGIPVVYRAIDSSARIRKTPFVWLIKWVEKYVYRNADLVLANNAALKAYGEQRGAEPMRTRVLFPGVAESNTRAFARERREGDFNVVFMGSLFRFAGLDWVIEGIAESPELRQKIRLKVIGDGEDRRRLEQLVDRFDLRKNVIFTGFIEFDGLYAAMSGSRVAILPFDDAEVAQVALPGKVPQYVMAGLPTVAVPLSGLRSLLREGEGVIYAERGREFLDRIARLLDDEVERGSVVERGLTKLRSECAWPDQARLLEEDLIRLVLGRK
jgi:glycosyltransferase involved in cell wall biosynthesis